MKKFATGIFIFLTVLPMLLYLNPFLWGMRRMPEYRPSAKTKMILADLNKKYEVNMDIGKVIDTVWYFRDLKNNANFKKENFEINFFVSTAKDSTSEMAEAYANDFVKKFDHKNYFDSIVVKKDYSTVLYKNKIK